MGAYSFVIGFVHTYELIVDQGGQGRLQWKMETVWGLGRTERSRSLGDDQKH